MIGFLYTALIVAAAIAGYALAKRFVRRRLRFVDAVYSPWAPWIVGIVAVTLTAPVAWLLPLVTKATTLLFGVGAGMGTASGVKALKRGEP
jgi:energy-converting hydrogenase Eha subunit G